MFHVTTEKQTLVVPWISCHLINWFLYGEIIDGCEICLVLSVENYIFRVPSYLRNDFQYTVISLLQTLSNNF